VRLVDCFVEIMAFTLHFLERVERDQPPSGEIEARYRELIAQAKERCEEEEFSSADQEAALLAVCAWVDEAILMSPWRGKEAWRASPLQVAYLGTWNGGEEFFARLSSLGEERQQALEVYDYCLSMGFKGSLFRTDDGETLERIKAEKRVTVMARYPALSDGAPLFPLSYSEATKKPKKHLVPPAPFLMGLSLAVPLSLFAALLFLCRHILDRAVFAYAH